MSKQPTQRPVASFTERTPRVVAASKLHRSAQRRKTGRFLAEGWNAVSAAIDHHCPSAPVVEDLYLTESAIEKYPDLLQAANTAGIHWHTITPQAAAALSDTTTTTGVFAVCRSVLQELSDILDHHPAPSLVLVGVDTNDPGNAGTMLRIADAFGASMVIFTGASVDPENTKCVRSSAGSIFHLPVCRHRDTEAVLTILRDQGIRLLATTMDGEISLDNASSVLSQSTAWIMGNEAHGLSAEVASLAHHTVSIPIWGRAESLNVATAASICLYTSAVAQRNTP